MENDEVRILRLLNMPKTKGEISEVAGLEDERLSTVLQMLKRNDLAQLTERKRWEITELGSKKLEESEKEEEPEEEPEPPQKESPTKRFEVNRKRRKLLNRCEELSSTLSPDWGWEDDLLKDVESLKEDVDFIVQNLNEAESLEDLEELEGLLEKMDKSWNELFARNEELSAERRKREKGEKLSHIREFYTKWYPELTKEEHEEMAKRCEEDPEYLKDAWKPIEWLNSLEYMLKHAFEYEINPVFIWDICAMAAPEALELKYVVQLWKDYNTIASRYGAQKAYSFIMDRGSPILKRRGSLWQGFHQHCCLVSMY